jgi:hypothetical protein
MSDISNVSNISNKLEALSISDVLNVSDVSNNSADLKRETVLKYYKLKTVKGVEFVICYKAINNDWSSLHESNPIMYNKINQEHKIEYKSKPNSAHTTGFECWTVKHEEEIALNTKKKTPHYGIMQCIVPYEEMHIFPNGRIRPNKFTVVSIAISKLTRIVENYAVVN